MVNNSTCLCVEFHDRRSSSFRRVESERNHRSGRIRASLSPLIDSVIADHFLEISHPFKSSSVEIFCTSHNVDISIGIIPKRIHKTIKKNKNNSTNVIRRFYFVKIVQLSFTIIQDYKQMMNLI